MWSDCRQLALDLAFPDELRLESFHCGAANAEALAAVASLSRVEAGAPHVYLWGPAGTGKTHLLVGSVRRAGSDAWVPYLDLLELSARPLAEEPVHWLAGLEDAALVCLDHLDAVAGDRDWEEALFHLYNRLHVRSGRLLMAARQAPNAGQWSLPDWGSRASAGLTFQLSPLQEEERMQVLQARARDKGLLLPREVAAFLLQRYPRDLQSLNRILDQLDRAALAASRRLTLPFVKSTLRI